MTKLRIFLADDHLVVREGMKALVNAEPDMEVHGEAADGRAAVERAKALQPDVAVIDLSMPELNGGQVAKRLKRSCPQTKVLALTVHEDKGYLRELLEAGVAGYVLKRAAAEELIRAIHTVAMGGVYLDPNMAGKVVSGFVRSTSSYKAPPECALSERESDVLRLIAQGYTNKEIAGQLQLSTKTVETYKARSMDKLELRSRVDIVRYAAERGWLRPSGNT